MKLYFFFITLGARRHNSSIALPPKHSDGETIKSVHTVSETLSKQHMDIDNYSTASYKGLPPHPPPGFLPFVKTLKQNT